MRSLRPLPPRRAALSCLRSTLAGLCVVVLAGCGRSEAGEAARGGGGTRIQAWTMWGGGEAGAFEAALAAFHASQDAVRVSNLPSVDDTKTIRAIVANDPPELFTLREPGYLGSLAANGALRPLDEEFRAAGFREELYPPGVLSQCRFRGRLYALLYLMDCWGLLWNPDAFQAAGLDPERPPASMEELLQVARRLTLKGAQGRVVRLGLMPPDPLHVIAAFGGQLVDPATGLPTADHPRNVAALHWYRRLIEAQGSPAEVNAFVSGFGQEQGVNNPFLTGRVAMMINGQWNPYWFQRYGPRVRYRAAPIPYSDPSRPRPTWLGGNLFCLPANGRHPEAAWAFLRWTQSPEAQILFAQQMHGVPNVLAARRDRRLRVGEPWKRAFGVFMDVATSPHARHFPVTPVSGLYQYEITAAADFVRFGNRTPEEALADVQQRVSREMRSWQP